MLKINYSKLLIIVLTSLFLLFTSYNFENKVFSPHFVDEEDNFVLGKYLLEGDKLYSDLFSHHQPLAYIFSAGIQDTLKPNSLYLLVKRHREAIMFWSYVWSLLLVVRFGVPLLLFVTIFESIKIFYFGNLFLSESLAVYPFAYITSKVMFSKNEYQTYELLFLGFCFSLCLLLLSPLWLVLFLELVIIFWQTRKYRPKMIFLFAGMVPIFLLALKFTSISEYFNLAFKLNFQYYIPHTSPDPLVWTTFRAFFAPIISLFTHLNDSQSLIVIQGLSTLLILFGGLLVYARKYLPVLLVFMILGLTNFRYSEVGLQYYSGFHSLPWIAVLIISVGFLAQSILKAYPTQKMKYMVISSLAIVLLISLKTGLGVLTQKNDLNKDYYINYSRQFDFGEIVRIMKSNNDSLMVVPDEWLIYWQGDINHRTRMLNYYAWMYNAPQLRFTIEEGFETDPPTFFYCDCVFSYFGLENYFKLYTPIIKDGKATKLLILKNKFDNLTDDQKERLKFFNVKID